MGAEMGEELKKKDLFLEMQAKLGCAYISSLPQLKKSVLFELKRVSLADYPQAQVEDFFRYVFGVPYAGAGEQMMREGGQIWTD